MAKQITDETLHQIKDMLKLYGFEEALRKTSVRCIREGIDADDYTYAVVALFLTYILQASMRSHSDLNKRAAALGMNSRAIVEVLAGVSQELGRQLKAELEVEEKVKANLNDQRAKEIAEGEKPTTH